MLSCKVASITFWFHMGFVQSHLSALLLKTIRLHFCFNKLQELNRYNFDSALVKGFASAEGLGCKQKHSTALATGAGTLHRTGCS